MRRVDHLDVQLQQLFPALAGDLTRLILHEIGRVQVADKSHAAVQGQRNAVIAMPGSLDDLAPDAYPVQVSSVRARQDQVVRFNPDGLVVAFPRIERFQVIQEGNLLFQDDQPGVAGLLDFLRQAGMVRVVVGDQFDDLVTHHA